MWFVLVVDYFAIFFLTICSLSYAQVDSPMAAKPATTKAITATRIKKDTIKFADTILKNRDSLFNAKADSTKLKDSFVVRKKLKKTFFNV